MGSDQGLRSARNISSYFNPRSPDGERRGVAPGGAHMFRISIHAPRMGSDMPLLCPFSCRVYFNPRSPDGERPYAASVPAPARSFQSTLPGWGATEGTRPTRRVLAISIHAPRMGSDARDTSGCRLNVIFQSTLPGWGATWTVSFPRPPRVYFNPRSPDGERPAMSSSSLSSVWISIHAPRMGSDVFAAPHRHEPTFQSTLPGWGATSVTVPPWPIVPIFQSTLPGWGATASSTVSTLHAMNFNPRSPDGERPAISAAPRGSGGNFNPRSPDGERLVNQSI